MIIGICGLMGSGKDTIANHLIQKHQFKKISFADKLKESVATMFDWDKTMLDGQTDESRQWREKPDEYWSKEVGKSITPRFVLQKFGTECMRDNIYYGIWVIMTKKKILDNPNSSWVIPDVRFENEVKMIKSIGGQVWWVRRGELPTWFIVYQDIGVEPKDVHPSEWAWAKADFDKILDNNSTVDGLRNQVQDHLVSI